jgi:hypothetical protein
MTSAASAHVVMTIESSNKPLEQTGFAGRSALRSPDWEKL